MLTRQQMEQAIKNGGSVLYGGRLITRTEHLPSDADLAEGNPEQEAAAAAALEAQIAALQAQRDRLGRARPVRTISGTVEQGGAPLGLGTQIGGLDQGVGSQQLPSVTGAGHESTEHVFHSVVGEELTQKLIAAGYGSPYAVDQATDEQLLAIDGVGPKTLEKLRAATAGASKE